MAKKAKDVKYYEAVGRRKEAVARVRLYLVDKKGSSINGKQAAAGEIMINNVPYKEMFARDVEQKKFLAPLDLTENTSRFYISILVDGGGRAGQIEAVRHGISRALTLVDLETYKPILKTKNLLTRDPRKRERRKVGTGGKARRQKQSPKR